MVIAGEIAERLVTGEVDTVTMFADETFGSESSSCPVLPEVEGVCWTRVGVVACLKAGPTTGEGETVWLGSRRSDECTAEPVSLSVPSDRLTKTDLRVLTTMFECRVSEERLHD